MPIPLSAAHRDRLVHVGLSALLVACRPLPATPLVPPEDVVAGVRDGDVVQLVDGQGNVIAGGWSFVDRFEHGVARAAMGGHWDGYHRGGTWGVIDKRGETLVPFAYTELELLGPSLVAVLVGGTGGENRRVYGGKWGVVDLTGATVLEPAWDGVQAWDGDLLVVNQGGLPGRWGGTSGGRWSVIDRDGTIVAEPPLGRVGTFSHGLASARRYVPWEGDPKVDPGECPNNVCQPLGYVDASGAWVIEPAFQEAYAFGEDGRARVYDGAYRYIDRTGAPASPRFTVIGDYGPEGLAYIHLDDGTRGYADRAGRVVQSGYDDGEPYSEGRAAVQRGAWGFVDANGRWAVRPRYAQVEDFSEGLAAVRVGGPIAPYSDSDHEGRWGFVDANGWTIISPRYADVRDFHGGLAAVAVAPPGPSWSYDEPKWGLVDRNGREIVPPIHDGVVDGGW